MNLERDYSLTEIAEAVGMSTRWVRDRCNIDKVAHIRYGNKIRMTADQVKELRAAYTKEPEPEVEQSITTGRKKAS